MTDHSCSYYCERPECIKQQRDDLRKRLDATNWDRFAEKTRREKLEMLIAKLHTAKGRYHTQLAACDLFDACGLKNERPVK